MKKLSVFIFLLLIVISSTNFVYAESQNICNGVEKINVKGFTRAFIKNVFDTYNTNYNDRKVENTYCLIFSPIDPIQSAMTSGLTFSLKDQSNVRIEGLNLSKKSGSTFDTPLLTIENNQSGTVTLANSQFTDVKNGIKVTGTGKTEIDHVVIKGTLRLASLAQGAVNTEGTCLELAASGAIVAASDISNCQMGISVAGDNSKILGSDIYENSEGIRIAADNTYLGAGSAENFATEANQIHANGTGINITSGTSNKFPFNSVYENQTYGILYDQIS